MGLSLWRVGIGGEFCRKDDFLGCLLPKNWDNATMVALQISKRFLILWGLFILIYTLASFMVWHVVENDRNTEVDRCLICPEGYEEP